MLVSVYRCPAQEPQPSSAPPWPPPWLSAYTAPAPQGRLDLSDWRWHVAGLPRAQWSAWRRRVLEILEALGHRPDGRAGTVATLSSLPSLEGGCLRDVDATAAFVGILESITTRVHTAVEAFENDFVTVDLFTGVLAAIEKYAWMLRAQLDS